MRERRQVERLLEVVGTRTRAAEGELRAAREALDAAEREYAACLECYEAERAKMRAVIAHLSRPEIASSAPRYADTLAMRDLVARDLERERFVFERAEGERREALTALGTCRDALARLRARKDALLERRAELGAERRRRGELDEEAEIEEQAATRYAYGG